MCSYFVLSESQVRFQEEGDTRAWTVMSEALGSISSTTTNYLIFAKSVIIHEIKNLAIFDSRTFHVMLAKCISTSSILSNEMKA